MLAYYIASYDGLLPVSLYLLRRIFKLSFFPRVGVGELKAKLYICLFRSIGFFVMVFKD